MSWLHSSLDSFGTHLSMLNPSRKWAQQTGTRTKWRLSDSQPVIDFVCLYNLRKLCPRPIKSSSLAAGCEEQQVQNAILFTLQMRLSYTMYSKMGLTASNSSHLPTKASFPESSSLPLLPTSPLPPLLFSLTHSPTTSEELVHNHYD